MEESEPPAFVACPYCRIELPRELIRSHVEDQHVAGPGVNTKSKKEEEKEKPGSKNSGTTPGPSSTYNANSNADQTRVQENKNKDDKQVARKEKKKSSQDPFEESLNHFSTQWSDSEDDPDPVGEEDESSRESSKQGGEEAGKGRNSLEEAKMEMAKSKKLIEEAKSNKDKLDKLRQSQARSAPEKKDQVGNAPNRTVMERLKEVERLTQLEKRSHAQKNQLQAKVLRNLEINGKCVTSPHLKSQSQTQTRSQSQIAQPKAPQPLEPQVALCGLCNFANPFRTTQTLIAHVKRAHEKYANNLVEIRHRVAPAKNYPAREAVPGSGKIQGDDNQPVVDEEVARREKAANDRIVGVEGTRSVIQLARYYKCKICKSTTKSKVLIVRHVLRAHADKVQEAKGDRERAKVIIREAIEVEDKWSCHICEFPGGSEVAMLSHARDKHGMTIKARPLPQQQQGSQLQARRPPQISKASPDLMQVQRSQSQVPGDRQQYQVHQVPNGGEMACFLCTDNGNRKSYPDSRLKAHLFAMHGCKVNQSSIRCNMCSFAAESVQQLGLHVQITHSKKATQGQSQGQPKKPLNPEFIRRLSDAGIAVSKRGVEVTVVDDKGSAAPSVAKYARRSEPAVTVDKKGLDLFIVGEVNRNNNGSKVMEHSSLTRVGSAQQLLSSQQQRISSMVQSRTNTQGAHEQLEKLRAQNQSIKVKHQPAAVTSMPKSDLPFTRPEVAKALGSMSKEQARQRAIQDLRARLTSKLKLNAQLQKMASTPNIESTKMKVLKELQLMKSQLQAMVAAGVAANANKNVPPRPDFGTPHPSKKNIIPQRSQSQVPSPRNIVPQRSQSQVPSPRNIVPQKPVPATNSPVVHRMKCVHCPFATSNTSALSAHVYKNHGESIKDSAWLPSKAPKLGSQQQGSQVQTRRSSQTSKASPGLIPVQAKRSQSNGNRYQRSGIKGSSNPAASQGPPEDEVEVVPQAQGNALTFQIKDSQGQSNSHVLEIPAGSAVPSALQQAMALAGEAVGSSDPGGEVVLQEIVGPAMELDLDIVCEDVPPSNDADRAPWMC